MSEQAVMVAFDEAVTRLPDGEYIHTFSQYRVNLMVGCDWPRAELLDEMQKYTVEESGPLATRMGHGLVLRRGGDNLFIATDPLFASGDAL